VKRALVALVVAISGCNAGSASPEPRPPPPAAPAALGDASADADVSRLAGKPLYLELCAPCHGADGKGYAADRAPSLVNPTFLESASDEFLRRSIAAGRPGTSMAAYGKASGGPLDAAGVDRLVAFLREQGPAPRPLLAVAAGDATTGSAIYAKRCFGCHGDAKTRGEAPSLANPQFQAAATDPFVRYAVANGRPGTKMEAFTGKLTEAELDAVVSYVRALGNGGAPPVALLPEPTGKEPLVLNPSGKRPGFTLRADPCPPLPPGAPPGAPPACKPDPRFVSVDQVAKAFAAKQRMVIIDARLQSDWRRVHITGAVSIPYHDMKRLAELPKDGTWIIAYCACPHHLSGIVVDELRRRGYAHAVVLDEGINDWHRRGLSVIAAEGVTKPLTAVGQ
jgi:mono/diheme cytochrome c family protein/rhodanese-related sulfurtransferase